MFRRDTCAQTSIDFLFGVAIFALAFIFVLIFIPGMFSPFNSNSDELTMTADRLAATLVEETLRADSAGEKTPGIIDIDNVNTFKTKIEADASGVYRQSLGLTREGGVYSVEVELEIRNNPVVPIITIGEEKGSSNIGQSRRFVIVRNPDTTIDDDDEYPGKYGILTVRVW